MDTSVPVVTSRVPTTFPDVPLERYWIPQEVFFRHPHGGGIYRLLTYLNYPINYGSMAEVAITVLAKDDGELTVISSKALSHAKATRQRFFGEQIQTSSNRFGYETREGYIEVLCEGEIKNLGTHGFGFQNFQTISGFGPNDRKMMLYQDIKTKEYFLSQPCLPQMERVYQK
jgi:hypothetical protein